MHKTLAFLALPGLSLAQGGNFTLSCQNITLASNGQENSLLAAYCHTHSEVQPYRNTTIDLNGCLGIDQSTGGLVWSYEGNYGNYCYDCVLKPLSTSTEIVCLCKPLSNKWVALTCINLDDEVSNDAGVYSCPNITGT